MIRRLLPSFFFSVAVLTVWSILHPVLAIPEYLVPTPYRVWQVIALRPSYIAIHALTTFTEALVGLVIASAAGLLLGSLFALFNLLERMLLPFAIASQTVPIVAVAPLIVLWFGSGVSSKVAMAGLICFFPMVVNTSKGLRSAGAEQIALMQIYNASRTQIFLKVRFPSSLPYVLSGLRVSAALAMIGAIVAEYAGADRGLGYVIIQSTYRLDTPELFAAILCAAMGGWVLYFLVVATERTLFRRFTKADNP